MTKLIPRSYAKGGQLNSLQLFTDFISKLEGWKTKCKNLHWAAPKNNIHVRLDEFLEVLSDYQDTLAEGIMGLLGVHLGPNDISGDPGNTDNATDFINQVKTETLSFYNSIPSDIQYCGLKSETETFIYNINKFTYLFSLCVNE